jgi:hypothetical protein
VTQADPSTSHLALLAYLGHAPALERLDPEVLAGLGELRPAGPLEQGHDPEERWRVEDWAGGLSRWGREPLVRAALAVATIDPEEDRSPTARACVAAARAWVERPGAGAAAAAKRVAARHQAKTWRGGYDAPFWAAAAAARTATAGAAGLALTAKATRQAISHGREIVTLVGCQDRATQLDRVDRTSSHRPFTARAVGLAIRDALLPWALDAELEAGALAPAHLEADVVFVPDGPSRLLGCRLLARRGLGGRRPIARGLDGAWIGYTCHLRITSERGGLRVRRSGLHRGDGAFPMLMEPTVHEGRQGTVHRCACLDR